MTSPAWSAGRSTASRRPASSRAPTRCRPLLDQSAEAGVLRHLGEAVAAHGHQHRALSRLLGQAFEERTALLQVLAQGEDLLGLVDGEDGAGWRVLRQRR